MPNPVRHTEPGGEGPMASGERSIRGRVAVVGIGETAYYKHGQAPDPSSKLALEAILRACADAGIDPRRDRRLRLLQQRPQRPVAAGRRARPAGAALLQHAVGRRRRRRGRPPWQRRRGRRGRLRRLRGGVPRARPGPVRALRRGAARPRTVSGEPALTFPYGLISPAQSFAMRVMRFMHEHGVRQEAQRAIALASYHHAQNNPRAVMHGRPLTAGGLRRVALDRRAVPPLRLLPWRTTAPPRSS